jgi:hypothetical protein
MAVDARSKRSVEGGFGSQADPYAAFKLIDEKGSDGRRGDAGAPTGSPRKTAA